MISRDRSTDYAAAAREAAPQALQVTDRYHLVHNLADALELLLARCRREIRQASQECLPEDEPLPPVSPLPLPPSPQVWRQHPTQRAERAYHAHQAEREDRYRQISALHARGMMQAEIAHRVGISTYQVRTWLKQGTAPVHRREGAHQSIFDPYAAYVLDRWQAGVHDGKQLHAEIQTLGFAGSICLLYTFLQTLRENCRPRPRIEVVPPSPVEQFSARNAVWLFIRDPAQFTTQEQEQLALIRAGSASADTAYGLVQDFLTMVHKRVGERLDAWIEAVQAS